MGPLPTGLNFFFDFGKTHNLVRTFVDEDDEEVGEIFLGKKSKRCHEKSGGFRSGTDLKNKDVDVFQQPIIFHRKIWDMFQNPNHRFD